MMRGRHGYENGCCQGELLLLLAVYEWDGKKVREINILLDNNDTHVDVKGILPLPSTRLRKVLENHTHIGGEIEKRGVKKKSEEACKRVVDSKQI